METFNFKVVYSLVGQESKEIRYINAPDTAQVERNISFLASILVQEISKIESIEKI